MSAKKENLPFPIGTTYYTGETIPNATDPDNLVGRQYEIEDLDYSTPGTGALPTRSNMRKTVMVCRNVSTVPLGPKLLVHLRTSTGGADFVGSVDGYNAVAAAGPVFPVDEWLPTTGVPVNDLFYVVVDGPAMCSTNTAGDATGTIAVGNMVIGATGAASTYATTQSATHTAGRVAVQDMQTGATGLTVGNQIQNRLGRALSAMASTQTGTNILVRVGRW